MSTTDTSRARRIHVKSGIYYRLDRNGRRRYQIVYRDSDRKQRWETVEGGVRAAEAALADRKARMGRGERVAPIPNLTFAAAAESWEEAQASRLRPATRATYGGHLRNHLLPVWGNRKLDSLTVDDVARLIESMQASGYKAWTIRGVLTVAGRIFDFANRRLAWAGQNPVRLLDHSERPTSDEKPRRILSGDELAAVLASADEDYRLIFEAAAGTGARLSEVLGLRWRSIDFERGTADITHQLDRSGRALVKLKTQRSRRTIELPAPLIAKLRAHKLASPHSSPDDYVFTTRKGTPHDQRNVGGRALGRAIKRAEIDCESQPAPTFHSFRHGFASAWIAAGGNVVELSAHLGHRDPAITASTYAHEFERASRSDERRSRIEGMYGGGVATNGLTSEVSSAQPSADPKLSELSF